METTITLTTRQLILLRGVLMDNLRIIKERGFTKEQATSSIELAKLAGCEVDWDRLDTEGIK